MPPAKSGASPYPRPKPIGTSLRGVDLYSGAEIAIYRLINGLTQQQVAAHLRVGQSLIAAYETGRHAELPAPHALRILDAIDFLTACRARLVAEGAARQRATVEAR